MYRTGLPRSLCLSVLMQIMIKRLTKEAAASIKCLLITTRSLSPCFWTTKAQICVCMMYWKVKIANALMRQCWPGETLRTFSVLTLISRGTSDGPFMASSLIGGASQSTQHYCSFLSFLSGVVTSSMIRRSSGLLDLLA